MDSGPTFQQKLDEIVSSNAEQLYARSVIEDIVGAALDEYIAKSGLPNQQKRAGSFSERIAALKAGKDPKLVSLVNRFRTQKNSVPETKVSTPDLLALTAAAQAIGEHLNYLGRPVCVRVPEFNRTVNSVSVDTPAGYKSFLLIHGDVKVIDTDLLVVSTHADRDKAPSGKIIRALKEAYGVSLDPTKEFMSFGDRWICFQPVQDGLPFSHVITLRMPKSGAAEDPAGYYDESIRGTFAAIAALEHMDFHFPVITMPVLYGRRLIDKSRGVESLIRRSVQWLKKSDHTHTVQFAVFYSDELDEWDIAMNKSLGRSFIAAGNDAVLDSLCREVVHLATPHSKGPLQGAVRPLLDALAQKEKIGIETVCVFGRKLVELMLSAVAKRHGMKQSGELMENIEALRKKGIAAPWIISYMHSLRIFGNETVHTRETKKSYRPSKLNKNDLVSALSAIRSLLTFWDSEPASSV